jgi:hypothetical protein
MQCQTAHNSPLAANVSPQSAHNNPQSVHTKPQSAHSSPQQPTTRNDEGRHDRRYTTRHKTHGEPSRLLFFSFLLSSVPVPSAGRASQCPLQVCAGARGFLGGLAPEWPAGRFCFLVAGSQGGLLLAFGLARNWLGLLLPL